jgi:hypothetical protein
MGLDSNHVVGDRKSRRSEKSLTIAINVCLDLSHEVDDRKSRRTGKSLTVAINDPFCLYKGK